MNAQILIKTANDWFEFSKSKTGMLDYVGKWENKNMPNVDGWQKLTSSTYYTPSVYFYVIRNLSFCPLVYIAPDVDVSDIDTFGYLVHIGAILQAVEEKNSALAGELYYRRREVFEKYSQLTQFILEPLCVEILFSLCYGRMANVDADDIPLIFESAKEKLDYDPSREDLDQAFIRYFKKNNVKVTLELVGTNFYKWQQRLSPYFLYKLYDNADVKDIFASTEEIREGKFKFYEGLEVSVQAEPYNPHDKNSILCCIEDPEAKILGHLGLEKVGHIRALAAKIIREAKPKKLSYSSKLCYFNNKVIVVEIEV